MQTILGAGGAIAIELAKILPKYTSAIRLVGRNPQKVNTTDELFRADLLQLNEVMEAVKGTEICYLTVGLEYTTKIWQEKWMPLVKNVVQACEMHNSKLVFFDNVYAIGAENINHITESSPISPTSKKGEVRAAVDQFLLDTIKAGKVKVIIARAPDFFGPVKDKSILMTLIYDNLAKGKKAQWVGSTKAVHSIGYTLDLADGTALLGNTEDAYNQIWNLPVDEKTLTAEEWTKLFAEELKTKASIQAMPGWLMIVLGIFIPILKQVYEMKYQFDRTFYFDSSKFNKRFNYKPTSNEQAVKDTILALRK